MISGYTTGYKMNIWHHNFDLGAFRLITIKDNGKVGVFEKIEIIEKPSYVHSSKMREYPFSEMTQEVYKE